MPAGRGDFRGPSGVAVLTTSRRTLNNGSLGCYQEDVYTSDARLPDRLTIYRAHDRVLFGLF
jgi:hypothetical protein